MCDKIRMRQQRELPMRNLVLIMIAVALFSLSGEAQTSSQHSAQEAAARKPPEAPYLGTWTGMFQGHAWIILKLEMVNDRLTGSLQHPHSFDFTDQGDLKTISDDQITETLQKSTITGDGLLLTMIDPATSETNRYALKLTGDKTGELKMVAMSMPPGMPKPKPWKVTRTAAPKMPIAVPPGAKPAPPAKTAPPQ